MPHRIYSIESRKGGVGKTTVALNLASVLVKRGPVLLIDCDISGTSIEEPALKSPFWENDTNVLKYIDKKNKELKPLNFLHYFINQYIKGEGNVGDFINRDLLKASKVNIIASSLTGLSSHDTIIRDWYMDELHSYWMMEFIERIIKEFEYVFQDKQDKTVHIIIDNSPGYTCFSQALHDYMYNEGPQVAKFLLVSTLDGQDLKASIELAAEINQSIDNRSDAALYYKNKENNGVADPNREALIESDDDIKDFFFHLNEELIDIYTKKWDSEVYLALLINKVPQSLKDDETIVAYKEMVGQYYNFLLKIAGTDKTSPNNLVYYDEAIIYQYYLQYLRGKMEDSPQSIEYWQIRIKELKSFVLETEGVGPSLAMIRLNTLYEELKSNLIDHEFAQLSRQLSYTWSPDYACNQMKKAITLGAQRLVIRKDGLSLSEVKYELHSWNIEQIHQIERIVGLPTRELFCLRDLIKYLEVFAGYDDGNTNVELMFVVSILVFAFRIDYGRHLDKRYSLRGYAMDIISSREYVISISQLIEEMPIKHKFLTERIDGMTHISLLRAYRSLCYCFIKWMDLQSDFSFLISAVELYVSNTSRTYFSKEMVDYLSAVFAKKIVSNENRLAEIRANSFIMKNMQDVLRDNILKAWK